MPTINQVLNQLDTKDDSHWTSNGLPLLTKVEELYGQDVKREDVNKAAPGFTRTNPTVDQTSDTTEGGENEKGEEITVERDESAIESAREAEREKAAAFEKARIEYEASKQELTDAISVATLSPRQRREREAAAIKEYQKRSFEERAKANRALEEAVRKIKEGDRD